jgi:hypothetical protein
MIRAARSKNVGIMGVGLNKVTTPIPGLIADFDFRGDLVDRVSGQSFDAVLPAVNSKTYERFGKLYKAGPNQARHTGRGVLLEGQGTNKCTCVKYNPQDTTNISDASGTVSIVDDSAELIAAGFSAFAGNVFKITATAAFQNVDVLGSTGNTNQHSCSVVARLGAGSARLRLTGVGDSSIDSEVYSRVLLENQTPSGTGAVLRIQTQSDDAIVYFTIPQLEEGPVCTSPIVGDNSASTASRATDAADASGNGLSIALDDIPLVKAALQSEGTMILDWVPGFDDSDIPAATNIVSVQDSVFPADWLLGYSATDGRVISNDGTNYATAEGAWDSGDIKRSALRWGPTYGYSLALDGSVGSLLGFSGTFPLGTHLRLAFGNELSQQFSRLRFYNRALTDEEVANV